MDTSKSELNEQELRALLRFARSGPAGVPAHAVECEKKITSALLEKKALRYDDRQERYHATDAGHQAIKADLDRRIDVMKGKHPAFKLHRRRFDTEKFGPAEAHVAMYNNKRPRIDLIDPETLEPIAVLTVNLVDVKDEELGADEVIVKTWSENMGITATLLREFPEVFEETDKSVGNAFVDAPVWKVKA